MTTNDHFKVMEKKPSRRTVQVLRLRVALFLLLVFTGACGGFGAIFQYQPVKRSVSPTEIAGIYQFGDRRSDVLELGESGMFTITGSSRLSGYGNWALVGSVIDLTYSSAPTGIRGWYVIEAEQDGKQVLTILGGDVQNLNDAKPMYRLK